MSTSSIPSISEEDKTMSGNSLEQVLQRLRTGNVTQGWGAVSVFSRARLNRLLEQQYIERLDEQRFVPPFSGTVDHEGLLITHSTLVAVEFGAPRLSFTTASMANSRAVLAMNVIGGSCTHASATVPNLLSTFTITEAMGFTLEMDIDLALVTGEVDRCGRVTLDLAKGASLRCNLGADDEQVSRHLAAAFEQWFKGLPAHRSVFELGRIDFDGYSELTPTRFIIRTQAAPGAKLASATNHGDGAVLTFIRLVANGSDGRIPDDSFPYLIPDDMEDDGSNRYSAVLVLDRALREHVSDGRLEVLAKLLFPGSHAFVERERHTPHDLAVFGSIDPLRTTFVLEPAFRAVRAGSSQQFVLRDGFGQPVQATRWRAVGLRSHTAQSQGSISPAGLYQAAGADLLGHDSLTVVVTADYEEQGQVYSASARLQVFFEGLEIAPRIATVVPGVQESLTLAASDAKAPGIRWELSGPAYAELLEAGSNRATLRPLAAARRRALAVQQVEAHGSETGNAAVLLLNGQQALAVAPAYVPRVKAADSVQVKDETRFMPETPRRWRVAGEGTIDAGGRFTAPSNTRAGGSVVVCEVVRNGVTFATGYSVLKYSQMEEEKSWNTLQTFTLKVPGGAEQGSIGALYPNGYQQLGLEMFLETNFNGTPVSLSLTEQATLSLFERSSNDQVEALPGMDENEGIADGDVQRWRTNRLSNRFEAAGPATTALPAPAQDDEGVTRQALWLHGREASGSVTTFYAGFQADTGTWHWSTARNATSGRVDIRSRSLPDFTDEHYTFERIRVDGGGGGPGDPEQDDFDYHPRTVDYWKLKYRGGRFETCQFLPTDLPEDQVGAAVNTSMLRWESEHAQEVMTSFTGSVFRDLKRPPFSQNIAFDKRLPNLVAHSDLDVEVDINVFEAGSLVISNHRADDVGYTAAGSERATLGRSLAVLLRDREGNAHRRRIAFGPAVRNGHRDHLLNTLYTAPDDSASVITGGAVCPGENASTTPALNSNGKILLAQKLDQNGAPAGYTTSVEIKDGYVRFGGKDRPKNDVISYFKIENSPSAVLIRLSSEKDEDSENDWYFDLRGIKYRFSTGWIEIKSLQSVSAGEIITPGLRMTYPYYDHGNIEGKLSGINIQYP